MECSRKTAVALRCKSRQSRSNLPVVHLFTESIDEAKKRQMKREKKTAALGRGERGGLQYDNNDDEERMTRLWRSGSAG